MVAIQIRDVPEGVRDALAAQAHASGQSLQRYLLALMTAQARRSHNIELLRRFAGRADGVRAGSGQTAAELSAEREAEG